MASIFISHSSSDSALAERVSQALRADGFTSLFLDFDPEDGIPSGRRWEDEIYSELRKADIVAFLVATGGPVTFADVIVDVGGDVTPVVAAASRTAEAEVAAKVAAGEISQEEADAVDVPDLVQRLAHQPGAPFLITPGSLPSTPAAHGAHLKRERPSLVIAMQPLEVRGTARWVVWFAVDPPIGAGVTHSYRAKCRTYVEVWIQATAGRSTVTLWRVPSPPNLAMSRTATAPSVTTKMSRNADPAQLFDAKVVGNLNGSNYSIYGGWVLGANASC